MIKKYRLHLLLCLLAIGSMAGCITTMPFQKAEPREGKVLAYVFRPESVLSRGTILAVNVNGEKRGLLINNSYIPVYADPGSVEISLHTNDFVKNRYDSMTLQGTKEGDVYFIKADPGLLGAFTLVKLDPGNGMTEISKTQYYPPR
ncbi:MAG: hypothetical protein CVU57_30190 [Deltaproteobacteria bacterium HGW-Deltaproteobacteria-15]|jgi:hypothetical protein|nr:MAG: hypothetical protein CVU57_30190 [Deltaproteobacteria bacterium HGW-Deltaproteobacteria-15]